LKWHLQSSFFLLHSAAIDLQEEKDSIDEEDTRPTSSTWSYINFSPPEHNTTWDSTDIKYLLTGHKPPQ